MELEHVVTEEKKAMLTFPQMYKHESYPKMKGYNFEYVTCRGSERVRKGQPYKN